MSRDTDCTPIQTPGEARLLSADPIEIDIEGDLDPRKFMGQAEEPRAGYQTVDVTLTAETDADDEKLGEWLEAVEERCPVSDNISNATPVAFTVDRS